MRADLDGVETGVAGKLELQLWKPALTFAQAGMPTSGEGDAVDGYIASVLREHHRTRDRVAGVLARMSEQIVERCRQRHRENVVARKKRDQHEGGEHADNRFKTAAKRYGSDHFFSSGIESGVRALLARRIALSDSTVAATSSNVQPSCRP